jgi:hypothetical protein
MNFQNAKAQNKVNNVPHSSMFTALELSIPVFSFKFYPYCLFSLISVSLFQRAATADIRPAIFKKHFTDSSTWPDFLVAEN